MGGYDKKLDIIIALLAVNAAISLVYLIKFSSFVHKLI